MREQRNKPGLRIALIVAFWFVIFGAGVPLAHDSSKIWVALTAWIVFLPAGLWALLPVPEDSFPKGLAELVYYASYWLTIASLHWGFFMRRYWVLFWLSLFIVSVSFAGCFIGNPRRVSVWR